jgi:RNA 2',3'-cyclic 3'-phosphodiesterase
MPRAFIAVEVPPLPPLLAALAELRDLGRAVRAVAPENLHLTLRFLGETPAEQLGAVAEVIRQQALKTPAFAFDLRGVGLFPDMSRPTVVWAAGQGDGPLIQLAAALAPGLEALGFASEQRPFVCHLTLARIKARPPAELRQFLDRYRGESFGVVRVGSVDLMLSELLPNGPQYSVAATVGLRGDR